MEESSADKKSKNKRGMKPRSQRNRKRPRSDLHSNDNIVIESTVTHLRLQGKTVPGTPLIRIVKPYPYTFCSFAKARWIGRTVFDVYCSEFGSYPPSYYETAIQQGRILVSDQKVDCDYKIQGQDVLSHTVHRHEPAVAVSLATAPYLKPVGETDDLVAFDKPSTLPVHPCGGYHQNSLMKLLEHETNYGKLYTIHRLDRLTSGLIVLAKNSAAAKDWGQAIQQRNESCDKLYLARVKGRFGQRFPSDLPVLGQDGQLPNYGEWPDLMEAAPNGNDACSDARRRNAYGYFMTDALGARKDVSLEAFSAMEHTVHEWQEALGVTTSETTTRKSLVWLNFACPVRIEQPKIGVCSCGTFADLDASLYTKTVKPAVTAFAVIKYNERDDSTLLLIRPATGRTHQIRIHLQHLGHCIANDPNYGGDIWFGNADGHRACELGQATLNAAEGEDDNSQHQSLVTSDVPATECEVQQLVKANDTRAEDESLEDFIKKTCVWCARNQGKDVEERSMLEFLVRSPGLWLHAFYYKVDSVSFCTDLPDWSRF